MNYRGLSSRGERTKRRSESYWREIVKAQRLSGLSQQRFCERAEISYSSFKNWSSRLREDSSRFEQNLGSFVPAVLAAESVSFARDGEVNVGEAQSPQPSLKTSPKDIPLEIPKASPEEDNKEQTQSSAKKEPDSPPDSPKPHPRDLEIRLGINKFGVGRESNLTIVVPQGFDELTLRRLLAVVGS